MMKQTYCVQKEDTFCLHVSARICTCTSRLTTFTHFLATVRGQSRRHDGHACSNEQTTLSGVLQKMREFPVACP